MFIFVLCCRLKIWCIKWCSTKLNRVADLIIMHCREEGFIGKCAPWGNLHPKAREVWLTVYIFNTPQLAERYWQYCSRFCHLLGQSRPSYWDSESDLGSMSVCVSVCLSVCLPFKITFILTYVLGINLPNPPPPKKKKKIQTQKNQRIPKNLWPSGTFPVR